MLGALKKVCELLESENLEYMVSGSLAVNTYTTPRMTRDIDLVISLKEEDVERFVNLFKDGYYCDADEIKREVGRRGMFNLIENASGATIDFIIKKASDFRNLEFERKQLTTVYGFPMWVVTAEDLLLSKLDWIQVYQSDRQISDITNLLDDNSLDLDYIRFWVEKLRLKTFDLPL
jgi:hypothetical protein